MKSEIVFSYGAIAQKDRSLGSREIGAKVEFHGIVRETERGAAVAGLQYEAYEPMARIRLEKIVGELGALYPCEAVKFIHRLGWVPVGEISLYVCVLAAHRGEAFALASELIDRLKQDVPIWKLAPAR